MQRTPLSVATITIALLAVTLLGMACGEDDAKVGKPAISSTATVNSLSSGDLCRYFTADDARAALGAPANPVAQPAPINTAGTIVETCAFANEAGTASVLFRESTATAASAAFDGARSATPVAIDVVGVGEKAFYNPALNQFVVKLKNVYFIVTLDQGTGRLPPGPAALKGLATAIAARI